MDSNWGEIHEDEKERHSFQTAQARVANSFSPCFRSSAAARKSIERQFRQARRSVAKPIYILCDVFSSGKCKFFS